MWQQPLQDQVSESFLRCLHIYKWLYRQRRVSRTTTGSDPPIYHHRFSLCLVSIWYCRNIRCQVTDYCRSQSYCYLLSFRFNHCSDRWVTYHYSFRLPLPHFPQPLRPLTFLALQLRLRILQWAVIDDRLGSEQMPVFLMQQQGNYHGYYRYIFHDHMNWHMSCSKSYFQNFPDYLVQQGSWPICTRKCTSDSQCFVRTPTYLSCWV